MINKFLITLTSLVLLIVSFSIFANDIYKAPKLKLDAKKGQTVVVKDKNWESDYKIENNSDRQIASMKDKEKKKKWTRDPSSKKDGKVEYWKYHQKYK